MNSPKIANKKNPVPGKGKSGEVTITRFITTVASAVTKTVDQVPVLITPHDLWMKHIENTPHLFLRDIIIVFASSIVPEDIRHNGTAMLEILENHNYGEIQRALKKLDPTTDKHLIEILQNHRQVAKYTHIAASSQFQENLFTDDMAKYISEAIQYLQYALVKISQ